MEEIELTKEEKAAIASLKRLARRWPKELWIFAADGDLHVMRRNKDHQRAYVPEKRQTGEGGGVDPDYLMDTVKIPSDGGDW